jgi:HD superfamily phosphodiesterase
MSSGPLRKKNVASPARRNHLGWRVFRWNSRELCQPLLLAALVGVLVTASAQAQSPEPQPGGDWHAKVRQFAYEHFHHPAWGFSHSVRDYDLARQLAREDKVTLDDDVLYAAAYLHDMAAFAPWDREKEGVDHADEAARIVDTVLSGTGFPMAKIDAVRAAIKTHMFDRDPVGPEAIYLHDADALDWLGAIGVARIIALVDPNGGSPDGPEAVKMLADNLSKVPQRVISPAGQRLAKVRSQELQRFLDELRAETDSLRTL